MLESTSLRAQLEAARTDRRRVLVIGAGIAGVTLARLLRGRGLHPVLVERAGPDAPSGYMLALMPLVDPVLAELGLTEAYRAASVPMNRYRIRSRRGSVVREYTMGRLLDAYGDYRGISRGDLMAVLGGGAVSYGANVIELDQRVDAVTAVFAGADVAEAEFDAVIAADGLHSATRGLVLEPEQVSGYETGWGGWVVWTDADADADLGEELWGAGWFVGTYPVKGRLGVIVCGPAEAADDGLAALVARIRTEAPAAGGRLDRVLADAADGRGSYYWPLYDKRSATWTSGRIALVGDAAAGFLPTAGIGAGMAVESAWVLAHHLAGDAPVLPALRAYERTQRPRVEAAQRNSRRLAPMMFNRSPAAAAVRDAAARFVPLGVALRPIRKLLDTRPSGL
ncbi:FAD-dependent oxidoreductase [Glycomyces harbinensis]|uniref:2-polyprenyl-6-methoxyphenol hydroxylase n=1 Tax=Glycomyces harbinensis TaxID=58114 RepID=A0A1G6V404_9ACTN|nr:NAD(P)/FAD-dependent oxidoreductase [Glycomyces harbinensis]SDD48194.1 2-polyprenyl-6-methoxyphenol hydroxylase [Glycomyces harbinensis]